MVARQLRGDAGVLLVACLVAAAAKGGRGEVDGVVVDLERSSHLQAFEEGLAALLEVVQSSATSRTTIGDPLNAIVRGLPECCCRDMTQHEPISVGYTHDKKCAALQGEKFPRDRDSGEEVIDWCCTGRPPCRDSDLHTYRITPLQRNYICPNEHLHALRNEAINIGEEAEVYDDDAATWVVVTVMGRPSGGQYEVEGKFGKGDTKSRKVVGRNSLRQKSSCQFSDLASELRGRNAEPVPPTDEPHKEDFKIDDSVQVRCLTGRLDSGYEQGLRLFCGGARWLVKEYFDQDGSTCQDDGEGAYAALSNLVDSEKAMNLKAAGESINAAWGALKTVMNEGGTFQQALGKYDQWLDAEHEALTKMKDEAEKAKKEGLLSLRKQNNERLVPLVDEELLGLIYSA